MSAVSPEVHDVVHEPSAKRVVVANRFYRMIHSTERGGALAEVRLRARGDENLFLQPSTIEFGTIDGRRFSAGTCERVDVNPETAEIIFESPFVDAQGQASGVRLRMTCRHGWGYMKLRQEVFFPEDGMDICFLMLQNWEMQPSLTHYGIHMGASAEPSCIPRGFCAFRSGHFSPGKALEHAVVSRTPPKYMCVAEPGRGGIEWFAGSELAQWEFQLTGTPGQGSLHLGPGATPAAMHFKLCPLELYGGGTRLSGRYVFDSCVGVPVFSGEAQRPFLHASFSLGSVPDKAQIAAWARGGVRTVHFHHDGDYRKDGVFWRDGVYPPFGLSELKKFDRVIDLCHQHGMQMTTYFSNKELHPNAPGFTENARHWCRKTDNRNPMNVNPYGGDVFGAQMCMRSGWADFFREYVDTVLRHHDLDGIYYDWNAPLYCVHGAHVGMPTEENGPGGYLASPAGHWDSFEMLEMMEWTRERVGPDGLAIIHNSSTPMAAFENFATAVAVLEFGHTNLSLDVPSFEDLPLEWMFMGARPRGVIAYGCLEHGAEAWLRQKLSLTCLLSGTAPWPVSKDDLALFAPLAKCDLAGMHFLDWRSAVGYAALPDVAFACYSKPSQAVFVVGNLSCESRRVAYMLDPVAAGLPRAASYTVRQGSRARTVKVDASGAIRLSGSMDALAARFVVVGPN